MMLETDARTRAATRCESPPATGTAKAGSVVYDLDVPDFTKAPLVMSGVSIGSVATSRIMTMNAKSAFAATLPGNITSTRVFDAGDTLGIYAEVYESVKDYDTAHRRR